MSTTTTTEASDILAAGAAVAAPVKLDNSTFVVVPEGYKAQDITNLADRPNRKRGDINVATAASFIDLVTRDATDQTRIYQSIGEKPTFVAVLNDHAADLPGWRDHRVVYACPLSVEWKAWAAADGKVMAQADFAAFIEKNLPDVVEPPAADMLEIALSLQAKTKVAFKSGLRLDNGQVQMEYQEEIDGSAGTKGRLNIPSEFQIGIPVFEGDDKYGVGARLRYRIKDGTLAMWFELIRPHKIVDDASMRLASVIGGALFDECGPLIRV